MLNFNVDKYNFWTIYEAIARYYPIGVEKNDSLVYDSFSGINNLKKIILENIHNKRNFTTRWDSFSTRLGTVLGKPVIGTTYGQAPSFSSYVEIGRSAIDNLTRVKELHFMVSLVGPFYSIVGHDRNEVTISNAKFRSSNFLIVSPEIEYASAFTILVDKIERRFKDYKFIPFSIAKESLYGLDVYYCDEKRDAIFHALFNDLIPLNIRALGDPWYKTDEWIRQDYDGECEGVSWTAYPPST